MKTIFIYNKVSAMPKNPPLKLFTNSLHHLVPQKNFLKSFRVDLRFVNLDMTERCALSFTWLVNLLQTRSIAQSKSIWFTFLFITIEGFTRNIASISIYFSLCIHPNVNMMDERSVHTFIEPVYFTRI